jgi:hypothetical protein
MITLNNKPISKTLLISGFQRSWRKPTLNKKISL